MHIVAAHMSLKFFIPLLFALIQLVVPIAACAGDLLPQDQAFEFIAEKQDDNSIRAVWIIADDYYMYRDKISFHLQEPGFKAPISIPVKLPKGIEKEDALFGNVEVYTTTVQAVIPLDDVSAPVVTLVAEGQGCNEPIGVCYPPMRREVQFALASTDTNSTAVLGQQSDLSAPITINNASDLQALLAQGFPEQDFLAVDDAFSVNLARETANSLVANFNVADGYYLYKNKIVFSLSSDAEISSVEFPDVEFLPVEFPKATKKQDQYFGEVEIFDHSFSARLALPAEFENAVITATYQGCAVDGICYAPVAKEFILADMESAHLPAKPPLLGLLLGAFVAGLLLTFTPCVLPMIPILTSIIVGQGNKVTRLKGGILSVAYVIGTMVTYAAMGALAGATGGQLQAYFENVWAIGGLSLLFLMMALSMFGLFTVQMPSFMQSAIQSKTNGMTRKMGGSIPLVFLLGLFSALIVGACVSPILVSFLGLAVSARDPVLGAQLMLSMALGMGIPLILLGLGAGHFIPKAGQWMEKVKQGFGVMLIAVAIYLLGLLPQVPVLLLWGGFFIVLSVFLGATLPKDKHAKASVADGKTTHWQRIEKSLSIILLIWGVLSLIGGFLGQRDLLRPIPNWIIAGQFKQATQATENKHGLQFITVSNMAELDDQFALALAANKSVMIDYYADWCVECVRMEKTTFADPEVVEALENNFIPIQIDLTDPFDANRAALKQRFAVFGPPATLFFSRSGEPLEDKNFYGYKNKDEFLSVIKNIIKVEQDFTIN